MSSRARAPRRIDGPFDGPSYAVALARALAIALSVAVLLLSALSSIAHAQSPAQSPTQSPKRAPSSDESSVSSALRRSADRHGLWGSLGLGRASAGLHCNACASDVTSAYAVQGALGIRLSPRFLVGVETFAWLDVIGNGVDRVARGTYLLGRLYMSPQSPLFLNGGLGVASFQLNDGEVAFLTRSPSLSLAAGYDWRVSTLTVTPSLAAVTSTGGRLNSSRTGNAVTENARLGLLRTSVSLSWFRRGGRP